MTLRIDFKRDSWFTAGGGNTASCTTPDGVTHSIPPVSPGKWQMGQLGGPHMGHGGVIYRMIIILADAGWVGEAFEAHDGRMVCLTGVIDKKAVPVNYGGIKREAA